MSAALQAVVVAFDGDSAITTGVYPARRDARESWADDLIQRDGQWMRLTEIPEADPENDAYTGFSLTHLVEGDDLPFVDQIAEELRGELRTQLSAQGINANTSLGGSDPRELELLTSGKLVSVSPFRLVSDSGWVQYLDHTDAEYRLVNLLVTKHRGDAALVTADFGASVVATKNPSFPFIRTVTPKAIESFVARYHKERNRLLTPPSQTANQAAVQKQAVNERIEIKLDDVVQVPPFDRSIIKGIYRRIVDVALKGTTIPEQYCYANAKTLLGLLMAGRVKFETVASTPQTYHVNFGSTGSGKGESYRRCLSVIEPPIFASSARKLKVVDSADSGAGLKDLFFEEPSKLPVLVYIDEIKSLGSKADSKKNPEILDVIGELADGCSISRVKAKKGKAPSAKSKDDAYLGVIACSPDSESWMRAITGRTDSGFSDRFTIEYAEPPEPSDLPVIDTTEVTKIQTEIANLLHSCCVITMSPEAGDLLKRFWELQPVGVRRKTRFRKDLQLDAYMNAFGCGSSVVRLEDMQDAITIFKRQLALREKFFTGEVPDRIAFYTEVFKRLAAAMAAKIEQGVDPQNVAMSVRDFQKTSNAYRNNELHIFNNAWKNYAPQWLEELQTRGKNNHVITRFIPRGNE